MASGVDPKRQQTYAAAVLTTAIASAVFAGWLAARNPRAPAALQAEDAVVRVAGTRSARTDMVIVALDDASVKQYGPVKAIARATLARGLRAIEDGRPKMVVCDLALDKRTKTGDDALWRTMANRRNVVLGMAYDAQRSQVYTPDDIRALVYLEQFALADHLTLGPQTQAFAYALFEPPVSDFTGSSRGVGVFVRETDPDGVLRAARLFYTSVVQYPPAAAKLPGKFPVPRLDDGAPVALPNLALVAAQRAFNLDKNYVKVETGDVVRLTGKLDPPVVAPIDEQGRMQIRYAGGPGRFTTYSFRDVVNGKVKPTLFEDKIVILGATAAGDAATDARATPFPGLMPRVEVTANALATLLDRSYVRRPAPRAVWGILLLVGLLSGLGMAFVGGGRGVLVAVLLLLGYGLACYAAFAVGQTLLPVLPGSFVLGLTILVALALSFGPFRPPPLRVSPTYVPPPPGAVR